MTAPLVDLVPSLLSILVKGAVILALAYGATWLLGGASASIRHGVWAVALFTVLLLPAAEWLLPQWSPVRFSGAITTSVDLTLGDDEPEAASLPPLAPPSPVSPVPALSPLPEIVPLAPVAPAQPLSISTEPTTSTEAATTDEAGTTEHAGAQPTSIFAAETAKTPPESASDDTGVAHSLAAFLSRADASWMAWAGWGFVFLWGTGVVAGLFWVAGGLVQVRLWTRRATVIDDPSWTRLADAARERLDLSREVTLYHAPDVTVPMTAGWRRPVVLLPCSSADWPETRRRMVLLHELAHVKRRDYATNLLAHLVRAVHWINPLAWVAVERLRASREQACDDRVLTTGVDGPDYAEQLVAIARAMLHRERIAGALAMADPSELSRRVESILGDAPRTRLSRRRALGMSLAAALLILPLAAFQPSSVAVKAPQPDAEDVRVEAVASDDLAASDLEAPQSPSAPAAPEAEADTTDDPEVDSERPPSISPSPSPDKKQAAEAARTAEVRAVPEAIQQDAAEYRLQMEKHRAEMDAHRVAVRQMETEVEEHRLDAERMRAASADARMRARRDTSDDDAEAAARRKLDLQKDAVEALSDRSTEQAAPRLLDIARTHPNDELRAYAVSKLDDHPTPDVAEALASLVNNDSLEDVRASAIYALSDFPEELALQRLVEIGQTHPDVKTRERAVYELDEFESEAAFSALADFAKNADVVEVRIRAIQALDEFPADRAVPVLVDLARSTGDDRVRAYAVRSLGDFEEDPRATEALMDIINEN